MGQVGFRTDWSKNTIDTFNVQGDMYMGLDGERVAISFYSPPSVSVINGPHHTSGGNLTGNWRRSLGENSDIEMRGYFDRTSRFSLNWTKHAIPSISIFFTISPRKGARTHWRGWRQVESRSHYADIPDTDLCSA